MTLHIINGYWIFTWSSGGACTLWSLENEVVSGPDLEDMGDRWRYVNDPR